MGSFLGLELAARDIPFQIIEKNPYIASKDDLIRSLTLNLSACERLDQLGITSSSSVIQEMNIFDGSGSGKLSFNSKDANIGYLAKVFGFNDLRQALATKVESFTSNGDEVTSFQLKDSKVHVSLSNEKILDTDLHVIAEGRNSTLAKSVASDKFYEQEIFALMPYKNDSDTNLFSVVWSMPKELAADLNQDNIAQHLEKFEKKISCRMKMRSELLSFPLSAHHLNEYCDHGICVIADAAHSIHPLAGQGINLGISDAMILA